MFRIIFFAIVGYLSGSVLFAQIFGKILTDKDIAKGSPDNNPGDLMHFVMVDFGVVL